MLGTLAHVFFCEFAKDFFIRKSFAKVGYYQSLSLYTLQLVKGYHLLPSGGPAGEWYRTFTFPFIGSSQASEGEASPQPNTMVLKHILALTAKARLCENQTSLSSFRSSRVPRFHSLRSANNKAPGVCVSSDAPPADGWGLRMGVFSQKFCEGVGNSQSAFWREWPSKPCKKLPNQQQPVLRRGFRDASCMFYKAVKKLSVIIWCELAGDERIFIRGVVAQHGFRER